jgi:Tfp pilus assembly protein PilN
MTSNINLLPPEIIEQRKAEAVVVYVLIGIIVLITSLGGIYAWNSWRVKQAEKELSDLKVEVSKVSEVINKLRKYEELKKKLAHRQEIEKKALADRIEWHKLLNEISMVIPDDITLTNFNGSENGIEFSGYTLDNEQDDPDFGLKPIARWLVHLSEIESLPDIWLTSTTKSSGKVQFSTSAKFKKESALPAPPPPSGDDKR